MVWFAAHVAVPCLPLPGTRGGLTSRGEALLPVYEASPLHHSKKRQVLKLSFSI